LLKVWRARSLKLNGFLELFAALLSSCAGGGVVFSCSTGWTGSGGFSAFSALPSVLVSCSEVSVFLFSSVVSSVFVAFSSVSASSCTGLTGFSSVPSFLNVKYLFFFFFFIIFIFFYLIFLFIIMIIY